MTIADPGKSQFVEYFKSKLISNRTVDATKPEEWDEEEDGEWIAPTIPNPKCTEGPGCGEWKRSVLCCHAIFQFFSFFPSSPNKRNPDYKGIWTAPQIANPAYKGVWAPRKIPNPDFFEDLTPVKSLAKIVRLLNHVFLSHLLIF